MTAVTRRPADAPDTFPPARAAARVGRRSIWVSSWRAALRLAARDARRHRGVSVLIVLMVGLPVLLLSGASAYLATIPVSPREALPVTLGAAAARVTASQSGPILQTPDGSTTVPRDVGSRDPSAPPPAEPSPVEPPPVEPSASWTTGRVAAMTGGRAAQVGSALLFAEVGPGVLRADSLAVSTGAFGDSGLVELVGGRLPVRADEVAVTPAGLASGLPRGGPLTVRRGEEPPRTVEVTGVVNAAAADYRPVSLVVDARWIDPLEARQFLVRRPEPVTWADVQAWNSAGLSVVSRYVLDHPRTATAPPEFASSGGGLTAALGVVVGLGLVLETALLAGPAFAVSATRRRRSLALVASNGAEPAQIIRYVLAQGVVLGALAALAGGLLGTLSGWGAVRVAERVGGTLGRPPLDFSASLTGLVVLAAVAASLVAASLPAQGAARLALAGELAEPGHSTQSSRRVVSTGVVLLAVGAGAVAAAAAALNSYSQLLAAGFGGGLMILGTLLVVGPVLRLTGHLLRRGPVPVRMAAREAVRAHSRSAPAVAAVLAATAVLTILVVANSSDDRQQARDYRPSTEPGHGVVAVGLNPVDSRRTLDEIRRRHPDWQIEARGQLGSFSYEPVPTNAQVVAAVPPGCQAADAVKPMTDPNQGAGRCQKLGNNLDAPVFTLPGSALPLGTELTGQQREVLTNGGVLVARPQVLRSVPTGPGSTTVRLAVATLPTTSGERQRVVREIELPAATLTVDQLNPVTGYSRIAGGLMLTATAERLGLPVRATGWEVVDPTDQSRGPRSGPSMPAASPS